MWKRGAATVCERACRLSTVRSFHARAQSASTTSIFTDSSVKSHSSNSRRKRKAVPKQRGEDAENYTVSGGVRTKRTTPLFAVHREKEVKRQLLDYRAKIGSGKLNKGQMINQAEVLYEEMLASGWSKRYYHDLMIAIYAAVGNTKKATGIFRKMQSLDAKPGPVTYNELILAHRKNREYSKAISLYEEMKRNGVKPGPVTLRTMIGVCARTQDVVSAFAVLDDMRDFKATTENYVELLQMARHLNSPSKAYAVFDHMKSHCIPLEEHHYSELICLLGPLRRGREAVDVLLAMCREGHAPTKELYDKTVESLGRGGQVTEALEVVELMALNYGMAPDQFVFGQLILACGVSGDTEKAEDMYREMLNRDIKPSPWIYVCLIRGCQKNEPNKVFGYHYLMTKKMNIPNNTQVTAEVLETCRMHHLTKKAFEVAERAILQDELDFDITLGTACAKALGDSEYAIKLSKEIGNARGQRSLDAFNFRALLLAYEGDAKALDKWVGNMVEWKIRPDHLTLHVFLLGALRTNRKIEVAKILRLFRTKYQLSPNRLTSALFDEEEGTRLNDDESHQSPSNGSIEEDVEHANIKDMSIDSSNDEVRLISDESLGKDHTVEDVSGNESLAKSSVMVIEAYERQEEERFISSSGT